VDDPVVKRLAPRLVAALDRAVSLATSTLRYGRAEERDPARALVPLLAIADEAVESGIDGAKRENIAVQMEIEAALKIDADPEQLFRILLNLIRNAAEALGGRGGRIVVSAAREMGR